MRPWFKAAQQGFAHDFVADPLDLQRVLEAPASEPVTLACGTHALPLNERGGAMAVALVRSPARTWKAVERIVRTADVPDVVAARAEVVSALTDADGDVHRWASYVLTHRRVLTVERGGVGVPLTPRGARTVVALLYASAPQVMEVGSRLVGEPTSPEPQAA